MADSKLTALTANTAPVSADILYIVDDPGGSPLSQKITWGNLLGSNLTAIYGLTSAADKGIYFTGSGTAAVFDLSTFARTILDDANAAAVLATIGAGTIATQAADNVAITGGSITNLTAPFLVGTSSNLTDGVGHFKVTSTNARFTIEANNTPTLYFRGLSSQQYSRVVWESNTGTLNMAIGNNGGTSGEMYIFTNNNSTVATSTARFGTTITLSRATGIALDNATTNAVDTVTTIAHNSTGTAAAGFGAALAFTLESSTTADTAAGRVVAVWETATHASRVPDGVFYLTDYGAEREIWRGRANGTAAAIGFLGATPVVRASAIADPTGGATVDAESRTAINAIIVVLENLGFIAT